MFTFRGARSVRLLQRCTFAACLLIWLLPSAVALAQFELLATHPDAAMQTTDEGRTLHTLHAVDGKLFVGYGDYSFDTGPISLRSFDPRPTCSVVHLEMSVQRRFTEFRILTAVCSH